MRLQTYIGTLVAALLLTTVSACLHKLPRGENVREFIHGFSQIYEGKGLSFEKKYSIEELDAIVKTWGYKYTQARGGSLAVLTMRPMQHAVYYKSDTGFTPRDVKIALRKSDPPELYKLPLGLQFRVSTPTDVMSLFGAPAKVQTSGEKKTPRWTEFFYTTDIGGARPIATVGIVFDRTGHLWIVTIDTAERNRPAQQPNHLR